MSEDIRTLAGRGVARRTVLKSSVVLAGAIAAPAVVSRGGSPHPARSTSWAGPATTSRPSSTRSQETGIKVNFNEQPDNEAIFAQAKLSLQTGAVDFCEPAVDRVRATSRTASFSPGT